MSSNSSSNIPSQDELPPVKPRRSEETLWGRELLRGSSADQHGSSSLSRSPSVSARSTASMNNNSHNNSTHANQVVVLVEENPKNVHNNVNNNNNNNNNNNSSNENISNMMSKDNRTRGIKEGEDVLKNSVSGIQQSGSLRQRKMMKLRLQRSKRGNLLSSTHASSIASGSKTADRTSTIRSLKTIINRMEQHASQSLTRRAFISIEDIKSLSRGIVELTKFPMSSSGNFEDEVQDLPEDIQEFLVNEFLSPQHSKKSQIPAGNTDRITSASASTTGEVSPTTSDSASRAPPPHPKLLSTASSGALILANATGNSSSNSNSNIMVSRQASRSNLLSSPNEELDLDILEDEDDLTDYESLGAGGAHQSKETPIKVLLPEETAELIELLEKHIDDWDFDIFRVEKLAPRGPLVLLGFAIFERHQILENFKIHPDIANNFFTVVQSEYKSLPYHNSTHAADVAQSMSHLFVSCGLDRYSDNLLRFASLVAAMVHDIRHPGLTNSYLVATNDPLAILYNDKSVLESMHCATAFTIMRDPFMDITKGFADEPEKVRTFRRAVISMIMATDNAEHNNLLARVKNWTATNTHTEDDRLKIMDLCVHGCDVSGSAKSWGLYRVWSEKITQEFHRQGDLERERGLRVLPIMDRTCTEPMSRFQIGFMRAIVLPLFETIALIPKVNVDHCINHVKENVATWESESGVTPTNNNSSTSTTAVVTSSGNVNSSLQRGSSVRRHSLVKQSSSALSVAAAAASATASVSAASNTSKSPTPVTVTSTTAGATTSYNSEKSPPIPRPQFAGIKRAMDEKPKTPDSSPFGVKLVTPVASRTTPPRPIQNHGSSSSSSLSTTTTTIQPPRQSGVSDTSPSGGSAFGVVLKPTHTSPSPDARKSITPPPPPTTTTTNIAESKSVFGVKLQSPKIPERTPSSTTTTTTGDTSLPDNSPGARFGVRLRSATSSSDSKSPFSSTSSS